MPEVMEPGFRHPGALYDAFELNISREDRQMLPEGVCEHKTAESALLPSVTCAQAAFELPASLVLQSGHNQRRRNDDARLVILQWNQVIAGRFSFSPSGAACRW